MIDGSGYEAPNGGYYGLEFVRRAQGARLQAIERAFEGPSRVIDLGCNDGRISCHLLERGLATAVTAIDLVDRLQARPAGLRFLQADLRHFALDALPCPVEVALCLNLLHHLVGESPALARHTLDRLLDCAHCVLVDMGSFTEQGQWPWRRQFDRHWPDDASMWDDLFRHALSRHRLLEYPAQNGGRRVLWRLSRHDRPVAPPRYRSTRLFRRTVASAPRDKRLVPVRDLFEYSEAFGARPGDLCPDVVFHVLQADDGRRCWGKQWLGERRPLTEATHSIEDFLRTLGIPGLCLSVDLDDDFGLVYPFDEELFESTAIVHARDRRWHFDAADCAFIERVASIMVTCSAAPHRTLGELTDFQVMRSRDGLRFLDFEPAIDPG